MSSVHKYWNVINIAFNQLIYVYITKSYYNLYETSHTQTHTHQ